MQQDPKEFFVLSELPSLMNALSISPTFGFKTSYACFSCGIETTSDLTTQNDLVLPFDEKVAHGCELNEYLKQFHRRSETTFCRKCESNCSHRVKVQIEKLGKTFVVCLARNGGQSKVMKKVVPSRFRSLHNVKHKSRVTYQLVSIIAHTGNTNSSGHFICFVLSEGEAVLQIGDTRTQVTSYSNVQCTLEMYGYFFFNKKVYSQCPSSSSSDSSDVESKLPKLVVKRRKIQIDSLHESCVSSYKPPLPRSVYKALDYEPKYLFSHKFGTSWQNLQQSILGSVVENISNIIHTSFAAGKDLFKCFRHCIYLQKRKRHLQNTWWTLDYGNVNLSSEFIEDLRLYMRKHFCLQRVKFLMEDEVIRSKSAVGAFIFKDSVISKVCEVAKEIDAEGSVYNNCNEYLKIVVDVESVIFYSVKTLNMDYVTASKRLGLTSTTFNDYDKQNPIAIKMK